jgi:hypothetical protein
MTKKEIIERLRKEFDCTSTYKNTTMKKPSGLVKKFCPHTDTKYFGRTRKNRKLYSWSLDKNNKLEIREVF